MTWNKHWKMHWIAWAWVAVCYLEQSRHNKRILYRQAVKSLMNNEDLDFLKKLSKSRRNTNAEWLIIDLIKVHINHKEEGYKENFYLSIENFFSYIGESYVLTINPAMELLDTVPVSSVEDLEMKIDYALEKQYLESVPTYSNCWAIRKASSELRSS